MDMTASARQSLATIVRDGVEIYNEAGLQQVMSSSEV